MTLDRTLTWRAADHPDRAPWIQAGLTALEHAIRAEPVLLYGRGLVRLLHLRALQRQPRMA
jgi:hypothetical protein